MRLPVLSRLLSRWSPPNHARSQHSEPERAIAAPHDGSHEDVANEVMRAEVAADQPATSSNDSQLVAPGLAASDDSDSSRLSDVDSESPLTSPPINTKKRSRRQVEEVWSVATLKETLTVRDNGVVAEQAYDPANFPISVAPNVLALVDGVCLPLASDKGEKLAKGCKLELSTLGQQKQSLIKQGEHLPLGKPSAKCGDVTGVWMSLSGKKRWRPGFALCEVFKCGCGSRQCKAKVRLGVEIDLSLKGQEDRFPDGVTLTRAKVEICGTHASDVVSKKKARMSHDIRARVGVDVVVHPTLTASHINRKYHTDAKNQWRAINSIGSDSATNASSSSTSADIQPASDATRTPGPASGVNAAFAHSLKNVSSVRKVQQQITRHRRKVGGGEINNNAVRRARYIATRPDKLTYVKHWWEGGQLNHPILGGFSPLSNYQGPLLLFCPPPRMLETILKYAKFGGFYCDSNGKRSNVRWTHTVFLTRPLFAPTKNSSGEHGPIVSLDGIDGAREMRGVPLAVAVTKETTLTAYVEVMQLADRHVFSLLPQDEQYFLMIDKCDELNDAIAQVFRGRIRPLLCDYHEGKAVTEWLDTQKQLQELMKYSVIYTFRRVKRAANAEEFRRLQVNLTEPLRVKNVIKTQDMNLCTRIAQYFRDNWFSDRWRCTWPDFCRPVYMRKTNITCESFFRHEEDTFYNRVNRRAMDHVVSLTCTELEDLAYQFDRARLASEFLDSHIKSREERRDEDHIRLGQLLHTSELLKKVSDEMYVVAKRVDVHAQPAMQQSESGVLQENLDMICVTRCHCDYAEGFVRLEYRCTCPYAVITGRTCEHVAAVLIDTHNQSANMKRCLMANSIKHLNTLLTKREAERKRLLEQIGNGTITVLEAACAQADGLLDASDVPAYMRNPNKRGPKKKQKHYGLYLWAEVKLVQDKLVAQLTALGMRGARVARCLFAGFIENCGDGGDVCIRLQLENGMHRTIACSHQDIDWPMTVTTRHTNLREFVVHELFSLTTLETANDVVAADTPECIRDWYVNTLTVDSIDDEVIRVWTPFYEAQKSVQGSGSGAEHSLRSYHCCSLLSPMTSLYLLCAQDPVLGSLLSNSRRPADGCIKDCMQGIWGRRNDAQTRRSWIQGLPNLDSHGQWKTALENGSDLDMMQSLAAVFWPIASTSNVFLPEVAGSETEVDDHADVRLPILIETYPPPSNAILTHDNLWNVMTQGGDAYETERNRMQASWLQQVLQSRAIDTVGQWTGARNNNQCPFLLPFDIETLSITDYVTSEVFAATLDWTTTLPSNVSEMMRKQLLKPIRNARQLPRMLRIRVNNEDVEFHLCVIQLEQVQHYITVLNIPLGFLPINGWHVYDSKQKQLQQRLIPLTSIDDFVVDINICEVWYRREINSAREQ